jgi:hypothetical protein
MPKKSILRNLTVLFVLLIFSALVRGDQKKNNPAPKAQVKSAPAPKMTQSKPNPTFNKSNTGGFNKTTTGTSNKPSTNMMYKPPTQTGNKTTTGYGNKTTTTGFGNKNNTAGFGNKNNTTGFGNKNNTTGFGNKNNTTGFGNKNNTTGFGNKNNTAGFGNKNNTTGFGNKNNTTGFGNKNNTTGFGNKPTTAYANKPGTRFGGRTNQNVQLRGGGMAQISRRGNGRVADIHANGMAIHRSLRGGRTIVAERNGRTYVSMGRRGGYVQRPYFNRGGRAYYQRTYVAGGRSYARVYRGWDYHGVRYYGYVHPFFYHPAFYGWAYHPWGRIFFGPAAWGWVGAPWWGFYGGFFTPFPVYVSPAFWLTDYLIAANLQAAYQAQLDANAAAAQSYGGGEAGQPPPENYGEPSYGGPAAGNQTPLSPEVKQAIADEVQRQLAAQQGAAANPQAAPTSEQVPDALNPAERVFVVSSPLDVVMAGSGQECGLTGGDVVMRLSDTPDANQNVTASIQSSKQGDCPSGQTVAIGVQDLQEMHNQFQAQIDSGTQTLAAKGGTGGLPKPPDIATTPGEVPPPTPDADAAGQLATQQQQADQTEAQVAQGQQ